MREKAETVLVTRFSALGDIAMTIPALYDACRANPNSNFVLLTRKAPARMFVNPPANLTVEGIDLGDYAGVQGLMRLASEMKKRGITMMVDLHDVLRTKILRRLLSLGGIKTFHIDKGRTEKKELTRHRNRQIHPLKPTIERYRDTFRKAGLHAEPENPDLRFRCLFPGKADTTLFAKATGPKQPGWKWIGVAPFAKHKGKIYPAPQMLEVLREIAAKVQVRIFLFAGGEDEERIAEEWAEKLPQITNLAPLRLGFEAEMALMNHCDVVVSMDSANMHLASLAGTRVVSIWGATHPYCGFMGFNQKKEDTIQLDMSCRPCSVFGDKPCRRKDYHCLYGITPQRIVRALGLMALAMTWIPAVALKPVATPAVSGREFLTSPKNRTPEDPTVNLDMLEQAYIPLRNGEFQEAFLIFNDIRPGRLPLESRGKYWYGLASCGVRLGLPEYLSQASRELAKDPDSQNEALFLQAYSAYVQNDFPQARRLFRRVPESYLPSLYEAGMYFQEGNWSEAARKSEKALERLRGETLPANVGLRSEAARIAGISRYRQGDLASARPLLEEYMQSVEGTPSADATYALGQVEYASGNSDRARELLSPLSSEEDVVGQAASYTIAQIDAAKGDDRSGALGFSKAAMMNFDPTVGQNAIYNYIAAGTHGASVPFASGAEMYERYVELGGKTAHDSELALRFAREYMREGNYPKAYETIMRSGDSNPELLCERQKVLYLWGKSDVENRRYTEAIPRLREAAEIKASEAIAAESRLWLGDAQYNTGDFSAAAASYTRALGGLKGANKTLALYNLGYALFNQDSFKKATNYFSEALNAKPSLPAAQKADARLRLADCYFYTRRYSDALREYTTATKGDIGSDYASMRRAVAVGLTGNTDEKIRALRDFPAKYPDSRWKTDAALELGHTLEALDRYSEAAEVFASVAAENPGSEQAREASAAHAQALLDLATSEAKAGNRAAALEAFRKLEIQGGADYAPEAYAGIMHFTTDATQRAEYAKKVLATGGVEPELMEEARFFAALGGLGNPASEAESLRELKELASHPERLSGARAAVELGEWQLRQGKTGEALATLTELTDTGTPHSYWLARGFIALSDAYRKQGNATLADEYLRSLQENYPGTESDIRNAIKSRLKNR